MTKWNATMPRRFIKGNNTSEAGVYKLTVAKQKNGFKHNSLAGIEYHGIPGSTQDCVKAVMRLIQFNNKITEVQVLTSKTTHCFILKIDSGDLVAIKSGFASGYPGEGPRGLSYVLRLLSANNVKIEEYKVRTDLIRRLDKSSLTWSDIDRLNNSIPVRPSTWPDYIHERDWDIEKEGKLWRQFPVVIPLAIIEQRLVDLAKNFWDNPDGNMLSAYRRLEDIVRARTGVSEHSSQLFYLVFWGHPPEQPPKLIWKNIGSKEQQARAELFRSIYRVFRNPRAHKEMNDVGNVLSEFLTLNHLYHLEAETIEYEASDPPS